MAGGAPTTEKAGNEPSEPLMGHPSSSVNSDNTGSVQKERTGSKLKTVRQWPNKEPTRKQHLPARLCPEADCPITPQGPPPVSGQFPLFILRSLFPYQISSDLFLHSGQLIRLQSSVEFQNPAKGLCTVKFLHFLAFQTPVLPLAVRTLKLPRTGPPSPMPAVAVPSPLSPPEGP